MSFGLSNRGVKVLAVAGFLFSVSAQAYIPPASFILSEALKTHDDIKTVIMEGSVTDLRNQTTVREVLRVDFASGRLSAAYFNGTEPVGVYESHVKDVHRLGKFWINLAMDPNRARFHEALQELNAVPDENTEVKLSRLGNHVTWTWGTDPVIAFIEDEFLPLEYQTGIGSPNNEGILLSEYTSSSSDTRVPKSVFVKIQGKEVYRYEVKSVKLNQTLKFTASATALKSPIAKDWVALVR